ncbi:MAG: HAD-IA family hydrolase [Candidatus Nanoarchaeia archaeon]|nr:HAD-IA family hydrolase [Candidatus Nanoarchaeia archaeon]MDD5587849.1 HAD-IA family hydrolase [Candidatus Nanoarchaeia archaeon]
MKTIIFDFDGTLADTFDSFLKIMNNLAEEYNFNKITKQDIPNLREMGAKEVFKTLNISLFKLPSLTKRFRLELNKEIKNLRSTIPIKFTLLRLKEKGLRLLILTSNSKENVETFLKKNNLELFDKIYSASSVFGKSSTMKKILKLEGLRKDEVFYVGDEVRDIEACKKVGVRIVVVTWGYNSKNILKSSKPDFLINQPKDLLKLKDIIYS